MSASIETEFSKTVVRLLRSNPFYAHLLMNIRRAFTDDDAVINTAMVVATIPPTLVINTKYFLSQDHNRRIGILMHEMLHLIFMHLDERAEFASEESDMLNIARDLVVNQHIEADKINADWQTIDKYSFQPNKTYDYYFNELKKVREKFKNKISFGPLGKNGCCKGHGGNSKFGKGVVDKNNYFLRGVIADAYKKASEESDNGVGKLPGFIKSLIETLIAPPKVKWEQKLRNFNATFGRGRVISTMKRESRRFGTVPGVKIKGCCRLLVCIDTSGSITEADLSLFSSEIKHLSKLGHEITILECDTRVYKVYPYRNKLDEVEGRGGTDLREIFKWMKDNKSRPDGCIILTDGYTPMEKDPMTSCKVLWVIKQGGVKCAEWGTTILIE